MQIFLDTANLEEIKKYVDLGVVDGVTTNPTLIVKEGVSLEKRIKEICKIVKGPVSSEVIATDAEGMVKEGLKYATWAKNVYVKVPMTKEGLKACQVLSKQGIKVNVTLVFTVNQALLAAKAGAALISPFVGRLDDISEDGMGLIEDIVIMLANYDFSSRVLVASVRGPRQVAEASLIGADIVTVPVAVLDKMYDHPLTEKGLAQFLSDWNKK